MSWIHSNCSSCFVSWREATSWQSPHGIVCLECPGYWVTLGAVFWFGHWGLSSGTQEGAMWHSWQREHWRRIIRAGVPVAFPEFDLWATALCFRTGIETRMCMTKLGCEPYSRLRLSSRLWSVLHRELRAGGFEKEPEAIGVQRCRSWTLGG